MEDVNLLAASLRLRRWHSECRGPQRYRSREPTCVEGREDFRAAGRILAAAQLFRQEAVPARPTPLRPCQCPIRTNCEMVGSRRLVGSCWNWCEGAASRRPCSFAASGTGKNSSRADSRPQSAGSQGVRGSIVSPSPTLLESELFGHGRGRYRAVADKWPVRPGTAERCSSTRPVT